MCWKSLFFYNAGKTVTQGVAPNSRNGGYYADSVTAFVTRSGICHVDQGGGLVRGRSLQDRR